MGLLGRFTAPKAKIELKLNEALYNYTDKLTGAISFDPLEDFALDELRLELSGTRKVNWKKGFTGYGATAPFETIKIPLTGPMNVQKGQHFEQSFQAPFPPHTRPDPFVKIDLKAKAVAAVKGRPDVTHELSVGITFPYVVECLKSYGGCGYVSSPSAVAITTCPNCSADLEEQWNKNTKKRTGAQGRTGLDTRLISTKAIHYYFLFRHLFS